MPQQRRWEIALHWGARALASRLVGFGAATDVMGRGTLLRRRWIGFACAVSCAQPQFHTCADLCPTIIPLCFELCRLAVLQKDIITIAESALFRWWSSLATEEPSSMRMWLLSCQGERQLYPNSSGFISLCIYVKLICIQVCSWLILVKCNENGYYILREYSFWTSLIQW